MTGESEKESKKEYLPHVCVKQTAGEADLDVCLERVLPDLGPTANSKCIGVSVISTSSSVVKGRVNEKVILSPWCDMVLLLRLSIVSMVGANLLPPSVLWKEEKVGRYRLRRKHNFLFCVDINCLISGKARYFAN